jgi:glutamate dehydrogenase/leucine dehydrogenase
MSDAPQDVEGRRAARASGEGRGAGALGMPLHELSPVSFCALLRREGISRLFFVWDGGEGRVRASHALLEPLARRLERDGRDFDRHEGVFLQVGRESGLLGGAFVHRTCRGQAAGGVRLWHYATVEDYLRDGLRLARGMTHKNALAGLWWGGGKGVIAAPAPPPRGEARRRIYEEYGELLSSLRGCYVTAEDAGTSVEDMAAVFSRTRFTTCIPPGLGGSGNPSAPTARGVVRGMEAALAALGRGSLGGKKVTVQGLGHVGEPLVAMLRDRGVAHVVASEVDAARREPLLALFPSTEAFRFEVRIVVAGDPSLLAEPADIFAPCATGGILGPSTIPLLGAGIVCGAANNQLEDPERDDRLLAERGVLYLPDFLVNRMGIVHCADEQYGSLSPDPRLELHLGESWENSIYRLVLEVVSTARAHGATPARIALDLAERRSLEPHPIWGHRGAAIIGSLAAGGWAT